jgi:hypothetical protein
VEPTVITVVRALPEPSPSPSPPARTDPVSPEPAAVPPASGSSGSGSAASGSYDPPYSSNPADPSDPADPNGKPEPDVERVLADPPPAAPDGRGERLLAMIAAICVFGVTSAIIRAIVAQRASGATGTIM